MAALTRFMAKMVEKALPFFKTLKKDKRFNWREECEASFQQYKETLSTPLTLTKPNPRETLYLYLAIASKKTTKICH